MKKQILLYRASDATCKILTEMKLDYKIIKQEELHETLGYLMELEGFTKATEKKEIKKFTFDLMILANIEDNEIRAISENLKAANANIERKCLLTQHNQHWTLEALLEEIDQEHTYFQHYNALHKLIMEAQNIDLSTCKKEHALAYQSAFMNGYTVLQERDEDLDKLKAAILTLQQARDRLSNETLSI